MEMTAERARIILVQAKKDEIYEGPVPEDDKKAISEANDLIEMAQQAWDQHTRGPQVETVLRLANEEFDGGEQKDDKPEPEPEPEPKPDPEPAPEPEGDTPPEGDDLSQIEPWEGYDKEKVSDILAGVNAAVRDYGEEDLTDLMANVWAYEAAHKNRKSVLDHLEDVAKRLENGEDLPDDPKDSDQDNEPTEEEPKAEKTEKPEPKFDPLKQKMEPAPEDKPDLPQPTPEDAPKPLTELPKGIEKKAPEEEPEIVDGGIKSDGDGNIRKHEEREFAEKVEKVKQKIDDSDLDEAEKKLAEYVEQELKDELLHTPQPPETEIPDLPWDWTQLSDAELQKFYGIYSASAYYKNWQAQRDERMAAHWREAANELHNTLLVAADKYDDNGKQKTMTLLEAEIESDENVKKFRRRQRKHETFASAHKRERDSMNKLVESLSRLESMRHQEWERSGQKGGGRR